MKKGAAQYTGRYLFIHLILAVGVVTLIWRMVDLTVLDRAFLQKQGDARTQRIMQLPAYRGMITDRNGEPLAISTPVESIWVNPQDFDLTNQNIPELAKLLSLNSNFIKNKITSAGKREFVYLKRAVTPHLNKKVMALKIPGLYSHREFRRFYPEGEVTAHILGFTNIDDRGQEGLELAYDNWLHGRTGKKRVLRDRLGHIIENVETILEPIPGNNLTLSIDRRIQYQAYRELKHAVEKFKARSGSVVILDVHTGEVLAMVNQPSFNPNTSRKPHNPSYRNRSVTDIFEPGSVIKAFSIASALMSGQYKPTSLIDTRPSQIMIDGNRIRDDRNNGIATVKEVLMHSSNVGVTKMILSLPEQHLVRLLKKVGFGARTGIGFPGESAGLLISQRKWHPFVLATLAFGYGMSVTPLQLAHAYSVFANDGRLVPVSLQKQNDVPSGTQVMSPKVASQMLTMLQSVVEENGTGRRARLHGYRVAGKTSTVRMVGPNGYEENHHIATFVGIVPADAPRLVIAAVVNDPRGGQYYGGKVAAPLFAKVAQGALRVLNILPQSKA